MKILGNILFIVGILVAVGTATDKSQTNEQKMQMAAVVAVFLSIGAYLSWGKKKSKDKNEK